MSMPLTVQQPHSPDDNSAGGEGDYFILTHTPTGELAGAVLPAATPPVESLKYWQGVLDSFVAGALNTNPAVNVIGLYHLVSTDDGILITRRPNPDTPLPTTAFGMLRITDIDAIHGNIHAALALDESAVTTNEPAILGCKVSAYGDIAPFTAWHSHDISSTRMMGQLLLGVLDASRAG